MESIDLSAKDQLVLFQEAARGGLEPNTELWKKGAKFCFNDDKEKGRSVDRGGSQLCGYLSNTFDCRRVDRPSLDLPFVMAYMDKAIYEKIFTTETKDYLLAELLQSDLSINEQGMDKILSNEGVRKHIREKYEGRNEMQRDEKIKKAYIQVCSYETRQKLAASIELPDQMKVEGVPPELLEKIQKMIQTEYRGK